MNIRQLWLGTAVCVVLLCTRCELVSPASSDPCPTSNFTGLTQTQLVLALTAPCRYDRTQRPAPPDAEITSVEGAMNVTTDAPTTVYVRAVFTSLQSVNVDGRQLYVQGVLQRRYFDARLVFGAWTTTSGSRLLLTQRDMHELVWQPALRMSDERTSSAYGIREDNVVTAIDADGQVTIRTPMAAHLNCWLVAHRFTSNSWNCSTRMASWLYNASDVLLRWESQDAVILPLQANMNNATQPQLDARTELCNCSMRHSGLCSTHAGNYSALLLTLQLAEVAQSHVVVYFLPSMVIVATSFVSFWLQADQTPARTTLGTATLLSFITLTTSQQSSFIAADNTVVFEVWFLCCTLFIFASLVEFAFVNTIWRRKRHLSVKKVNSRYVLRSTVTPRFNRFHTPPAHQPSSDQIGVNRFSMLGSASFAERDSTTGKDATDKIDTALSLGVKELPPPTPVSRRRPAGQRTGHSPRHGFHVQDVAAVWSLSPHETSAWLDRKARFLFPLLFIVFNAIFWMAVLCT